MRQSDSFRFHVPAQKNYTPCKYEPVPEKNLTAEEKLLAWFKTRAITPEIVKKRGIELRNIFMPQTGQQEWAVAFPFMRDGQVVNVKYRTKEKHFRMEAGCEPLFYGIDAVNPDLPLVIVEGEMDQLSCEVAGVANSISVPSGTGSDLNTCLLTAEHLLIQIKKIILAGDADEPGMRLMQDIARRFGVEKCYRVEWPEGCKDANEVLASQGPEVLKQCIESAQPLPIMGLLEVQAMRESIWDMYELGMPQGVSPGWGNVGELFKPRLGELTVITGIPGMGKSSFVSALAVNLADMHGWQFAFFSPENAPPARYITQLMEIKTGKPFDLGPRERMTMEDVSAAMDWAQEKFVCIEPEMNRTVDTVLDLAKKYIYRRGIQALVIDPWNHLEHSFGSGSETAYIGEQLKKIKLFATTNQVHVFIVVHPAKPMREKNGELPVPTLYDCAGSANWFNMADNGLCIHRNKKDETQPAVIHVQKIRFRHTGRLGEAALWFDRVTGRYSEGVPLWLVKTAEEQRAAEIEGDSKERWWDDKN